MLSRNLWSWDKVTEGMQVYLVNRDDAHRGAEGIVTEVKRSRSGWMIDGKPVQSLKVQSVTVTCNDGQEITVTRTGNPQYQIFLK